MIENVNASKMPSNGEFVDVKKYLGVASVNVLAVNPKNATLRKYGWNISEDADEPTYTTTFERNGKPTKAAKVRFLVQIQDFDDKPVIALDFWIRPGYYLNKDESKCQIIDSYGRTAWVTKEEMKGHKIPQYSNGPANLSSDYKPCHRGEDSIVAFLMKWLNMTPYDVFRDGIWTKAEKPGRLTIDNWKALCDGDVKEVAEAIAMKPDNRCKVIFGVRKTDDNKTYQAFYPNFFMANGARCNLNGIYQGAQKELDRYFKNSSGNTIYDASVIHEYKEQASQVTDSSQVEDDLPFFE